MPASLIKSIIVRTLHILARVRKPTNLFKFILKFISLDPPILERVRKQRIQLEDVEFALRLEPPNPREGTETFANSHKVQPPKRLESP